MTRRHKWYGLGAGAAVLAIVSGAIVASAADAQQHQPGHDRLAPASAARPVPRELRRADQLPSQVSAVPGDKTITLRWQPPTQGAPTGYRYGRDGVDSTGSGAWASDPLPTTTRSAVLDKLINGTEYRVFVEAVYPTGNQRVTLAVTPTPTRPTPTPTPTVTPTPTPTPTPTTTPTPTPTPTATPTTGRPSGLAWSSGVWANGDRGDAAAFTAGPRGGRALDNILVYTSRNSMAAQNNPGDWRSQLPTNFNAGAQDLVLAVTTWTSDGAYLTSGQAAQLGTSLCAVDGTRPIVRIDWEMNLQDGAGDNGAVLTAANYNAWVARFRAVATGIKSTCGSARIDFNVNHGVDQTAGCNPGPVAQMCTRRAFQALKDVIDIYGVDTYDSYPPVTASGSGWGTRIDPNATNELENARRYALANGKLFSVPEWGVACNSGGCQWQGNAGGDDPEYVRRMVGYFKAHAGDLAYETYFNEYDPYILSDLIDHNPNGRAAYRTALGS